ncbi:MAG: DUF4396 domain-containing protein [Abditibacteriaceae bacterium]
MSFDFLRFLTNPAFVLSWYGFGILAAAWTSYDLLIVNRHVASVLKAVWPIIIVFFSVIGLIAYIVSCRPSNIGATDEKDAEEVHKEFVSDKWKKVLGSVMHCVGGDGLGIVTAMVITRWLGLPFWTEFWIEYAAGFAFGWFIFQYWAMRSMGNNPLESLLKGGRAEFFSMMTLMLGMGLVSRYVTPAVVGHPPTAETAAFWGFAAFGLLVGTIFTYPMNWWLVSIKWKHGMG